MNLRTGFQRASIALSAPFFLGAAFCVVMLLFSPVASEPGVPGLIAFLLGLAGIVVLVSLRALGWVVRGFFE